MEDNPPLFSKQCRESGVLGSPHSGSFIALLRYSGEAILCRLLRERNRERGDVFVLCNGLRGF